MKAAIVTSVGTKPIFGEFQSPISCEGMDVITVHAEALSNLTKGRAAGSHYSADNHYPFVPGVDGVGTLADGRRVYFAMPEVPFGAMAEQTLVDTRSIIVAVAKAVEDAHPVRFVQVGEASREPAGLPAAALRSSAIQIMGSGLKSVPLPRLLACVRQSFELAAQGKLNLPTKAVPLAAVEEHWDAPGKPRLVFTLRQDARKTTPAASQATEFK